MSLCNMDCFNCIYSDCINNEDLTEEIEIIESDGIVKKILTKEEREKRINSVREWQKRNPDKFKMYNAKHKATEKYKENRHFNRYKSDKKYYYEHREEILRKKREKRIENKLKTEERSQVLQTG